MRIRLRDLRRHRHGPASGDIDLGLFFAGDRLGTCSRRLKLRAALGDAERVHRKLLLLAVHRHLESIGEQRLQHPFELCGRAIGGDRGGKVEARLSKPVGPLDLLGFTP